MANATLSFTIATVNGSKSVKYVVPENVKTESFDTFRKDFRYCYIKNTIASLANSLESKQASLDKCEDSDKRKRLLADIDAIEQAIDANDELLDNDVDELAIPDLTVIWTVLAGHFPIADYVSTSDLNTLTRYYYTAKNPDTKKQELDTVTKQVNSVLNGLFDTKSGYFHPRRVSINSDILNETITAIAGAKAESKVSGQGFSRRITTEKQELKAIYTQLLYKVAETRLDFPKQVANKRAPYVGIKLKNR